jgi:hypothetical protein
VNRPAVLCVLLSLVTLAAYWPTLRHDFVNYDDPDYFTSNPRVLGGLSLSGIRWAFTTGHAGNWHPVTWLSLMLDASLFGTGPAGPHFTNLALHCANAALLFLLLRGFTGSNWRSLFAAGLFALHPLHVESVAWVSERKDVLSGLFFMLTLWAYGNYARRITVENRPPPRRASLAYLLPLALFALGLMSKPMLVTVPFLLLLMDWWPLGRMREAGRFRDLGPLLREKWAFFALSALSCVVTFIAQQRGGAVTSLVKMPLALRIENAFVSCARYIEKGLWPSPLAIPYPYPAHWDGWLVVFSAALVAGLSALALLYARRLPFVPTGWFWFVGSLVPVIGIVQVGNQSMADRYT